MTEIDEVHAETQVGQDGRPLAELLSKAAHTLESAVLEARAVTDDPIREHDFIASNLIARSAILVIAAGNTTPRGVLPSSLVSDDYFEALLMNAVGYTLLAVARRVKSPAVTSSSTLISMER